MATGIKQESGREFQYGANILGNAPGVTPDWTYSVLGIRASLTVELSPKFSDHWGFCLPRDQIESQGYEQFSALLALADFLAREGDEPSSLIGTHRKKVLDAITVSPTPSPTMHPTPFPTALPTPVPTQFPTQAATQVSTQVTTPNSTAETSHTPTQMATQFPTQTTTQASALVTTPTPTLDPTHTTTQMPTQIPTSPSTPGQTELSTSPTAVTSMIGPFSEQIETTEDAVSKASQYGVPCFFVISVFFFKRIFLRLACFSVK